MSKFLSTLSLRRATRFFDVSLNYFYPRSPCGERLNKRCEFNGDNRFLSTLSLRRATVSVWCFCGGAFGFLSTLSLRRATNLKNTASRCRGYFYPRSPCGERRLSYFYIIKITQFLSTLSLRRATLLFWGEQYGGKISIHALLAESDGASNNPQHLPLAISIHALLAESDGASSKYMSYGWDFYPRSPCGERRSAADLPRPVQDFYPRSPCGERQVLRYGVLTASLISIHALLAESDIFVFWTARSRRLFLSTLSLRRATVSRQNQRQKPPFLSTLSLRRATCQ